MLPEDIRLSRFIILWGTNTLVTNLHLWPFIREARAHGATVVVIDPVATRTAWAADRHVQPAGHGRRARPGMMQVVVAEGLHDADFVDRHTLGFEALCERLSEYPSDRVAAITRLQSEEIVRLARAYAAARPSTIRMLFGMEHRAHGGMTYRTIACLPALVGAWRELAGGLLLVDGLACTRAP